MKIFLAFRLFVLCLAFHSSKTGSIPSHLLTKIDHSLTWLEDTTTDIKNALNNQTAKHNKEFSEIKELLKLLDQKIGRKQSSLAPENVNVNVNPSGNGNNAVSSPLRTPKVDEFAELFLNDSVKFCGYNSKLELLEKVAFRDTNHYHVASTNEELNKCVYLDGPCGGVLVGRKGIISYRAQFHDFSKSGQPRRGPGGTGNNRTRCIWTVRTNDPKTKFRLYLREGNVNGFKLSLTSMQSLLGAGDDDEAAAEASMASIDLEQEGALDDHQTWPNGSFQTSFESVSGYRDEVFFISLAYNRTTSIPDFFIRFEGSGTQNYYTKFYHYHKNGGKGHYSSKIDFQREEQRAQNEFATFVVNPHDDGVNSKAAETFQLNLTGVQTGNAKRHEYFSFFESRGANVTYQTAGGSMSKDNRYHGSNRTFTTEFLGDILTSEVFVGIMKFFNPNEIQPKQRSSLQFSW